MKPGTETGGAAGPHFQVGMLLQKGALDESELFFTFDEDTGKLTFAPWWDVAQLPRQAAAPPPEERAHVEEMVRRALDGEVDAIRVGELFCHECGEWVAASPNRWRDGMCLPCWRRREDERDFD